MKILLGALVAAALFGLGCAHEQEVSARTEGMRSPRASAEGMALMPGYMCEVAVASAVAAEQPRVMRNEAQTGAAPGDAPESTVIVIPVPEEDAAPEEPGIGGSALEPEVAPDAEPEGVLILPTPEPEVAPAPAQEEPGIGGSAPEDDVFEDTGMGGGGGGGG